MTTTGSIAATVSSHHSLRSLQLAHLRETLARLSARLASSS